MMSTSTHDSLASQAPGKVTSFDPLVERFEATRLSFTESDALKASHWAMGEDARLREDVRFRPTPWGRWVLTPHLLANDVLFQRFLDQNLATLSLELALQELDQSSGCHHVFCPADPRFVLMGDGLKGDGLRGSTLRLSASQLSDRPLLEEPDELEKFTTHLPLHTLQATAASQPRGEWGPGAQEQHIETLGWVQVKLAGQRLNERMFVARIKGHSMDNGRSGLHDGAYAVFELWPTGDQTDQVVLARGSFRDPENGSFAVKKLGLSDVGKGESSTCRVLRSLNPDKARFPDIALPPEDEAQVRIVAALVQALAGDDYVRSPRRPAIPGMRDLRSEEGLEKQAERLRAAMDRLFEIPESESPQDKSPQPLAWESHFLLADPEAGGLHIGTTPLAGLPNFVKKLELHSGTFTQVALAVNLRTKPWRIPVPPSSAPYVWSAVGFEDEVALQSDLERLRLEGVPTDRVSLFRLDVCGMGQRLSGSSLTPGQGYRLLVPPSLEMAEPLEGWVWALAGGWRVWELVVPGVVPPGLSGQLEALGFQCATAGLSVTWTGDPPRAYREARTGERYPWFHPSDHPVVRVQGLKTAGKGELVAFLAGPEGLLPLPLPAGELWHIGLEDLTPGRYILEIVHQRTQFSRARLPFEVDSEAGIWPAARVVLLLGDGEHTLEGVSSWEQDLTELGTDALPWQLAAPPLWPIRVTWDGHQPMRFETLSAGEAGQVDLSSVVARTSTAREQERQGELHIDAGELGLLSLRHQRSVSELEVHRALQRLMDEQGDIPVQGSGEFQILRKVWFEPICRVLGYALRDLDEGERSLLPSGTTAWVLCQRSDGGGRSRWTAVGILLITRYGTELRALGSQTPRDCATQLCTRLSLSQAILTDGFCWALQESGKRFMARPIDLRDALREDATGLFEDFLSRFVKE